MDAGAGNSGGIAMSDVTMHPLNMSQVNDLRGQDNCEHGWEKAVEEDRKL